jgi:hypothetical protein
VVAREAEVVDLKLTLQPVQESQSKTSSETFGIDMVKMDTMDLKHRHVYEVIKDGVNTEPEWCKFPGRDQQCREKKIHSSELQVINSEPMVMISEKGQLIKLTIYMMLFF